MQRHKSGIHHVKPLGVHTGVQKAPSGHSVELKIDKKEIKSPVNILSSMAKKFYKEIHEGRIHLRCMQEMVEKEVASYTENGAAGQLIVLKSRQNV